MGGGASKSDDPSADAKANNTSTKNDNGPTSKPGNNPSTQDDGAAARGMVCTVTDAVTNNQVPFQSSVANIKPKKGRRNSATPPVADDSSVADSSITIRFSESIVITGSEVVSRSASSLNSPTTASAASTPFQAALDTPRPHPGSVSQLKQVQASDRGSWKASLAILEPSTGGGCIIKPMAEQRISQGVLVGGAYVTYGGASVDTIGVGGAAPNADEKAKQAAARAALFASKTRFAQPTNYTLSTCGGQSAAIRAVAASSDGTQFASVVAPSKNAQYFDAISGRMIMEIKGHSDPIVAMAHSRDGKFLLTSSTDGTVCMWDLNNGKKLREVGVNSQANSVAISDDSEIIATSSTEDFVNLWESKNGDALTLFQRHSGAVYCVAFSRRGGLVASGSHNGEVFVWGAQVGDVRHHIETGARTPVSCISFSHDGTRLVTADREILQVWDLFTGSLILTRNGTGDCVLGEPGRQMHAPTTFVANGREVPRITAVNFAACNNIVVGLTTKRVLVIEPNHGVELLSVELKGIVTCLSVNWAGDVVFIGDFLGNHYRLVMTYAHRDVMEFNLNSKPPAKERGKEKD